MPDTTHALQGPEREASGAWWAGCDDCNRNLYAHKDLDEAQARNALLDNADGHADAHGARHAFEVANG